MTLSETIATISRLSTEVVDQLTKERADFEALQQNVQVQKEEIIRRGDQLTKERRVLLDQVEPLRKEREELAIRSKTIEKLETAVRAEIDKYDGMNALVESQKKKLDEKLKEYELLEKEKLDFKKKVDEFQITKDRILKTEAMFDFKQKSLDLRESQIKAKEDRAERLYAST